jgi:hypothetical protein
MGEFDGNGRDAKGVVRLCFRNGAGRGMWRCGLRPERQPLHARLRQSDAAEFEEIAPVHNRAALLERDSASIVSRGKRLTQALPAHRVNCNQLERWDV